MPAHRTFLALMLTGAALLSACGAQPSARKSGDPENAWFKTEVLSQTTPVLVDFGADWCGPCRSMEPSLDKLADTYSGKLKVVRVNIEEHPDLPQHYAINGIPHLMIYKGGKIVSEEVGAMPFEDLESWIKPHLN